MHRRADSAHVRRRRYLSRGYFLRFDRRRSALFQGERFHTYPVCLAWVPTISPGGCKLEDRNARVLHASGGSTRRCRRTQNLDDQGDCSCMRRSVQIKTGAHSTHAIVTQEAVTAPSKCNRTPIIRVRFRQVQRMVSSLATLELVDEIAVLTLNSPP